jgi:hypothetical protein
LGAAIREAETIGVPWVIDPSKRSKHLPKVKRETVIGEHAAAALRLLIFTGARLREILYLKWEHVDFERGLLLSILSELTRAGSYVIAGDSAATSNEKPRTDIKRRCPVGQVSRGFGYTTYGTISRRSAPVAAWVYRSSASCLVTHSLKPRRVMLTSTLIHFAGPQILSGRQSRLR